MDQEHWNKKECAKNSALSNSFHFVALERFPAKAQYSQKKRLANKFFVSN